MTKSNLACALVIPDSLLAKEATEILRNYSTDLLFDHSIRVYLFAAAQGRQRKLRFDPELLYVAAAFHDLGLIKKFASQTERFEVDGATAARQFPNAHNIAEDQVQAVWEAIALHTTPGIPKYMRPEVALLNSGVLLDVLGVGFDQFPAELREQIVAKYRAKISKKATSRSTSPALRTSLRPRTAPSTPASVNVSSLDIRAPTPATGSLRLPSRIPHPKAQRRRTGASCAPGAEPRLRATYRLCRADLPYLANPRRLRQREFVIGELQLF